MSEVRHEHSGIPGQWLSIGGGNPSQGSEGALDSELDLVEPKQARPRRYLVVMLNDDYTPMHFVVEVLQSIFDMDESRAVRIMLDVHTGGSAVCGIYTREIAETKSSQAMDLARTFGHPLVCRISPAAEDDPC